jgi:hypothetical protein
VDEVTMLSEARRRLPAARTALAVAIGDMPCSGASQGGSGTSDRTGRIALGVIDGVDQAWTDSRELDRLERIIIAKCNDGLSWTYLLPRVLDIVDRWAPTGTRRRAIESNLRDAADGKGDDGCHSCARVKDSKGHPLYSEQHPGLTICKSCYDMLKRVRVHDKYQDAELVPIVVLEWRQRHAGKNVSVTILERLLTGGVS